MAAAKDEFVTILELSDPVHAEIVRDVLAQEGIEATIPGSMHSSMLGAAGRAFLQIRVQVPASRAAEARAIVDALEEYDEVLPDGEDGAAISAEEMERRYAREDAEAEEGEGPYRRGPLAEPARGRRSKRLALMCGLGLTFGSAHFYARDTKRALLLLTTQLLLFGIALNGHGTALLGVVLLVVADLWGAMRAVDRYNEGRDATSAWERLQELAPALAVGATLATVVGPWMHMRIAPVSAVADETRAVCELRDECYDEPAETCVELTEQALRERDLDPYDVDSCAGCAASCDDFDDACLYVCPRY